MDFFLSNTLLTLSYFIVALVRPNVVSNIYCDSEEKYIRKLQDYYIVIKQWSNDIQASLLIIKLSST